jgi:sigma-E factor negative regulatory protein RseC
MTGGADIGLHQRLRVTGVYGSRVRVRVERASGCASCALRKGCGTGALADMAGGYEIDLNARTRDDLPDITTGDDVIVSMASGRFLGSVALAYLVPMLVLVLTVATMTAAGLPEGGVAGFAMLAFVLSFVPLWLAERRGGRPPALDIIDVIPARRREVVPCA